MNDFSHWDFADEFTARQAAALIRGLDPDAPGVFIPDTDPVLNRLRTAYEGALYALQVLHDSALDIDTAEERRQWLADLEPELLHSVAMTVTDERIFFEWMFRRKGYDLDAQRFARAELARWLRATSLIERSKYQFDRSCASEASADAQPMEADGDAIVPPSLDTRPEKNATQMRVAEAILVISRELGHGHPRDMKPHRGKTPGPKQAIFNALRTDQRYKHLPLEPNKRGKNATFDAAWTIARKPDLEVSGEQA